MNPETPNAYKMKFTKTETEYNMKSIRFLLLTITTMFIIIACLMIVMGMSVYTHYHSFSSFFEGKSGQFLTPSVMCVLLGMALLVVTSFGFFGSLKQSTCMVNLYALILSILLTMKLAVVIVAFTVKGTTVMKYIDIPVRNYVTDPEYQVEIDGLQQSLNCCGSTSYLDYMGLDFGNISTAYVTIDSTGDRVTMQVPETCCTSVTNDVCALRSTGCKEALTYLLVQNSSVLGVLGVSIMFIQLLGIIFALLLARCIRRLKSENAVMRWKTKEQMILARQIEESEKEKGHSMYIEHPQSSTA